jgi:hypothetical protein
VGSPHPRQGLPRAGFAALTATLTAVACWSSTALGASESLVPCDNDARNLTSLDVVHKSLLVNTVDLANDSAAPTNVETLGDQGEIDSAATPFLYLTPRVANLLRDVFRATELASATPAEIVPSSPLADSGELNEPAPQADDVQPAPDIDDEGLPAFQQQRYRKDI